ncbi:hypothetical protein IW140_002336 [Coemansia sp. RSA 1813]|nr:hypothetical protein EV178_001999 [Coemansia sp. RSA 1646]KAJ1771809.1 hypothetical protein LPJ74_001983 [Coemansia sp. RSA 1843]KAJ2090774.1 hypothetical protein IW138_002392 [Coemansia sp. RSA 986]KAJ2216022.1 hypothetical protein EV179_001673 [Coemansia sp. RSA 487]KAJ2570436.1 hypothetical protein IW140_002336 [Coemansia sp. RSA 1813]
MTVAKSTVKPGTTFELSEMENSMVPYPVLQYTLIYKDTEQDNSSGVNKVEILKDSFERLTQLYPIVLGHKERVDNRNIIVVSEDDLLKQRIFIHQELSIAADEFAKIKCRRDLWPANVDTLLKQRTADTECLIAADVVCFKDGYLLTLSTSHIVADVSGLLILLEQWASIARKMANAMDAPPASLEIMPDREIDFDHAGFWQKLISYPKDDHPHISYVKEQDCGETSQITKFVKDYYGSGARNGDRDTLDMRVLHVSGKNIERLGASFNTGDRRRLHGVQILYALFWQRYVANNLLLRGAEADHSQTVFLNIIHNVRNITSAPDYVGNAVAPVYVHATVGDILTRPIIETAHLIKSHINSITPGATAQCAKVINNPNDLFLPKLMYLQRHPESGLVLSNASRFPFFALDFGIGKAIGVHFGKVAVESSASWVPHIDGGVELYFGAKDDIYNMLKNDAAFTEYLDFEN